MVPIYILWYRESWTIQLKYTFETKQERIKVSYHPTNHHGHTNHWSVYVSLERELISITQIINWVHGPEPRLSGGNTFSYRKIDIHGCYSLVKIAFTPICTCKNNRQIWRHNASISRSRDVTDQLWWRHNTKSENAVLGDSCEMSDRWWFLAELCVPGHKIMCKK